MCCAVKAAAVAAPPKRATTTDVDRVGLKDAPLASLYPPEPKPPAPVSGCHVGSASIGRGRTLCPNLAGLVKLLERRATY